MKSEFTAEFFRGNREKLRTLFIGTAPIVITANGLLQRNSDISYPFRQDSNFWYLTGIDKPDITLVMDKGKEYLIIPEQQEHQTVFDGAIDANELTTVSGVEVVLSEKEGWQKLGNRLKRAKHIATLAAPASYVDFYGFYSNPARAALLEKAKTFNKEIELLDLKNHLTIMRMIKQPDELAAIQSAIGITISTLKDVKRRLPKYLNEYEIEADLTQGFRKRGATGHAFTPIVAAGKNACVIHYIANNGSLSGSHSVLIDVGAEVNQYAADISATFWLTEPNKREASIYEAVKETQELASTLLKPGVMIREYEKQIEQFMGEKLRELGLIKNIERETVRKYFPHATSHHLGLDPHDIADYDRPLEEGMVLAVEPGIYIPEEEIGIRLENNVLIVADGCENLSKALAR